MANLKINNTSAPLQYLDLKK